MPGLTIERRFTKEGEEGWEGVTWGADREAVIKDDKGKTIFKQTGVEAPTSWSALALNVVASKYFRGTPGTPEREKSVKALISRVADTIANWGDADGYFELEKDMLAFRAELRHLLVMQMAAFNSPVWFNVGVEEKPQCSACFINSVEDSMESILGLAKTEGMLFKFGSGTGSNLSTLRSSRELLKGGGEASGPVSFMKGFDAFAGVIKSGGKTRRAAKMVILNADHPDILQFVRCKAHEEKKAHALIDAGYDPSFNGEAYSSVFFQNSNNSVRMTSQQMVAVEENRVIPLRAKDGTTLELLEARKLFREIAEAAHACGDPGLQFDTVINRWHTCPNTDRIHGSNPCSEYMFLDDTACNLASLNLMKFRSKSGEFDTGKFRAAIDIVFTAMEIIVGRSSYPTPKIAENSRKFRPLGLGYANLGALLMTAGLPYDDDSARSYAAAITSLMCARAYRQSARLAKVKGAFEGFRENRDAMLGVISEHRFANEDAYKRAVSISEQGRVFERAQRDWDEALTWGAQDGFRNAQATVLAPTGTIGFMMDCDTTGIEPDIALIKYKTLVGGGQLAIVNQSVPEALRNLGYDSKQIDGILAHLTALETIEGSVVLKAEHLPVFDCAFKPKLGERSIAWEGHIKMMGACQPFLSGAISKTVNMPRTATVEDIERAYTMAWKLGVKAIAVYRDGCKRTQPLNTSKEGARDTKLTPTQDAAPAVAAPAPISAPVTSARVRLPDDRVARTHKFSIGGHEGYMTAGLYPNGQLGELFVTMAKEGSTISGLVDAWATMVSIALQHGVPLSTIIEKMQHTSYQPAGFTANEQIRQASSITDYIARKLALDFGDTGQIRDWKAWGLPETVPAPSDAAVYHGGLHAVKPTGFQNQSDAPPCPGCGNITVRSGSCYKCSNCGSTTGCS
jgi:ribonucleoside-diphosphate reductase alpha chain